MAWQRIRWAAAVVSTIILVPVVGEFFVRLAEEFGWYEHPTATVKLLTRALNDVVEHDLFHWIAGGVLGFTGGVWLDAVVRRRQPATLQAKEIDREALAAEAEGVSRAVATLLGQYYARRAQEWQELRAEIAARGVEANRHKLSIAEANLIEKYGEKYHSDVWRIIALAQKCVPLDKAALWHIDHGMGSLEVERVPKILSSIAAQLRHPQSDIPMYDSLAELQQSAAGTQNRDALPPGGVTDPTQPSNRTLGA